MTYERYLDWIEHRIDRAPDLSVVIPAYNEEERIMPTIGAIAAYCCGLDGTWELIVADDGSTDATAPIVRQLDFANVRVLSAPNQGKGAAVRRGVLASRGEVVLFTDADLSTPIQQLGPMLRLVDEHGADVVVGSRAAVGADVRSRSLPRRVLSSCTRSVAEAMLGLGLNDTQCGFKLFTAEAARILFSRQTVPGFAFDLEILYLARRNGLSVVETPVEWHDAPGSKVSGGRDALRGLRDLLAIRLRALRGAYRDVGRHEALEGTAEAQGGRPGTALLVGSAATRSLTRSS